MDPSVYKDAITERACRRISLTNVPLPMSSWHCPLCHATNAMDSSKPTSLLDLPFEIREIIYSHVFGYGIAQLDVSMGLICSSYAYGTSRTFSVPGSSVVAQSYINPTCRSSQMLRTCRKIFEEARPIFVKQTKFVVSPYASLEPLMRGLGRSSWSNILHIIDLHIQLKDDRMAENWAITELVMQDFPKLETLVITGFSADWLRMGASSYWQTRQKLLSTLMFKFSISQMKHLEDLSDHKLGIFIVIYNEKRPFPEREVRLC
jgi:hypothetical protein